MKKMGEVGAGFDSRIENIDTTTPAGGMMKLDGAFAEFEHAMIAERTSPGLAADVVVLGQKTAAQLARMFSVSPPTCHASSPLMWSAWHKSFSVTSPPLPGLLPVSRST